ncbi:MAG: hypothetical protein R3D02_10835 [Hyphomicrobiales bacterium]
MGITRDDLVYDVGRHVDGNTVQLFEVAGPADLEGEGHRGHDPQGRRQSRSAPAALAKIMINGEGYKTIVAEAAEASGWRTSTSASSS